MPITQHYAFLVASGSGERGGPLKSGRKEGLHVRHMNEENYYSKLMPLGASADA